MTVMVDSVQVHCDVDCCGHANDRLFEQMSAGGYGECSVMRIPAQLLDWRADHKTARKRADRAFASGYVADALPREKFSRDIHNINVSAPHRQGRPMSAGYLQQQEFSPLPKYPCARHAVRITGVFSPDGHAVAYLVMLRSGDLALVSQILGHAAHLEQGIMFLLFETALHRELAADADGFVVYNRHDSGTKGLQWFKERLGFREETIEWLP